MTAAPLPSEPGAARAGTGPFFLDLDRLTYARTHDRDVPGAAALEQLRDARRRCLRVGPFSVMDKEMTAPTGDKHDFLSIPTYFWPNPATADGLPWQFVDGKKNPGVARLDSARLFKLTNAVEVLTFLAWYDDDAEAAERAVTLLRTWFLAPETRMNPHLTYAQLEFGKPRGNSIGIIDFQRGYLLLDYLQLLRRCSDAVTDDDVAGMHEWIATLLDWLLNTDMGTEECERLTNHGTWFDAQVVAYHLALGHVAQARNWLESVTLPRLEAQVTPDGDQPRESARVSALQYCVFNLFGHVVLAELGRVCGLDLWNHTGAYGQGIRRALDWLLPSLVGHTALNGPITKTGGSFSVSAEATMTLRLAAIRYGDQRYAAAIDRLTMAQPACRGHVLVPRYP